MSAALSLRFDPPRPPFLHVKLPRGSRPLVWVYYQNILTKYRVSATRISCCGRLTEWPLSLRTLMQQRAALSGGNLPPPPAAGGQRGTLERPGADHRQSRTLLLSDLLPCGQLFHNRLVGRRLCARRLDAPA